MPETDLQAVTSGVEAALGSTAETAHSFWEKYLGANALSKIIAAAILLIVCVVFIKLLMRLTGRLLEKSKLHTTMHSFIRALVKLVPSCSLPERSGSTLPRCWPFSASPVWPFPSLCRAH